MQTWLNLQDKIIIVTGGASGIGLAIVEELLAQGANVQMVDIHGGDGQYESHKGYQFWPTDISSAKEINHTVAEIIQRFGRIDGLVNNAGVNFPRLLVDEKAPAGQYELNEAAFEKMVNINQKGVFLMSQAVARQMVKQHDGVIVNQTPPCRAVLGYENEISRSMQKDCKGKQVWFTRLHDTDNGAFLRKDGMLCMAEDGVVTSF